MATEDITSDETLIRVPNRFLISPLHISRDPEYSKMLQAPGCQEIFRDGDRLLMLFVMHERAKGKDSRYYPYLR